MPLRGPIHRFCRSPFETTRSQRAMSKSYCASRETRTPHPAATSEFRRGYLTPIRSSQTTSTSYITPLPVRGFFVSGGQMTDILRRHVFTKDDWLSVQSFNCGDEPFEKKVAH